MVLSTLIAELCPELLQVQHHSSHYGPCSMRQHRIAGKGKALCRQQQRLRAWAARMWARTKTVQAFTLVPAAWLSLRRSPVHSLSVAAGTPPLSFLPAGLA